MRKELEKISSEELLDAIREKANKRAEYLEGELEAANSAFAASNHENDDLQTKVEELEALGAKDKINALLDLVERPIGTLAARLPDSPQAQAALMALYEVAGRGI